MLRLWIIAITIVLCACSPTLTPLPTQVRLPTETLSPTADTLLTDIAANRTPLPPSFTPTFTPSMTPTLDPSITPSATSTMSVTPSATITDTPSPVPTDAPLDPGDRPVLLFALTAAAATVLPTDYQVPAFQGAEVTLVPQATATTLDGIIVIPTLPDGSISTPVCTTSASGGFASARQSNPLLSQQLGCPIALSQTIPAARQPFQNGTMIWLNGEIIVLYNQTGTVQIVTDNFVEGVDPQTTSEVPPNGLVAPIRGFLKAWSNDPTMRASLGWGIASETGTQATVQAFTNGRMIHLQGMSEIIIITNDGTSNRWSQIQGNH